jgi:uncharacterized protein (TIGR02996 family)
MTTEEAFQADIQANPGDASLRLIYADWLQEQGREDLAIAYRWSAKHDFCPYVSPKGRIVGWHGTPPGPSWLPRFIFDFLPRHRLVRYGHVHGRGKRPCKHYPTVPEAFIALAAALKCLRDLLAC